VALIGRASDAVATAVADLRGGGEAEVFGLSADMSTRRGVESAFGEVTERWQSLNVLVNAIGPTGAGRFEALDDEAWLASYESGTMSVVRSVRAALPAMRAADWARIVNLTAISVQHQSPGLVSYTAAKSALASVTKNLARSLASDGILVNAVAPGPILTDWAAPVLARAGLAKDDAGGAYELLAASQGLGIDLGRLGLPEEVAAVVAFCASRRNTFMTGAQINVDGGSDFL
jgi:NAD(P)-dependent dehydrogenase (short-subunit alcohol dehydrogenase family)